MNNSTCPHCGVIATLEESDAVCPGCILRLGLHAHLDSALDPRIESLDRERVARLFPDLDIGAELGRGGMGVVYAARDRKLDRTLALKLLPPEDGADPGFASRFLREARAMAGIDHPNIVRVYGFGEVGGAYFIRMELVDGTTLRDVMQGADYGAAAVLSLVPGICAGLDAAHAAGIVHRDIKPENIFVTRDSVAKVGDFGIAKRSLALDLDPPLTERDVALGTPRYMAPEQVSAAAEVDQRADIYALGVILYEALTGTLPLGRFEAPSVRAAVNPRFDSIVMRCLEAAPTKRYARASEVAAALARVEGVSEAELSHELRHVGDAFKQRWRELGPRELAQVVGFGAFVVCSFLPWWEQRSNPANRVPPRVDTLGDGTKVTTYTSYGSGAPDGSAWQTSLRAFDVALENAWTVWGFALGVVVLLWPGRAATPLRWKLYLLPISYSVFHLSALLIDGWRRSFADAGIGAVLALIVLLACAAIALWRPVRTVTTRTGSSPRGGTGSLQS